MTCKRREAIHLCLQASHKECLTNLQRRTWMRALDIPDIKTNPFIITKCSLINCSVQWEFNCVLWCGGEALCMKTMVPHGKIIAGVFSVCCRKSTFFMRLKQSLTELTCDNGPLASSTRRWQRAPEGRQTSFSLPRQLMAKKELGANTHYSVPCCLSCMTEGCGLHELNCVLAYILDDFQ